MSSAAAQQRTQAEAQAAHDLVLRDELSGATPTVREFEREWRRRTGIRHALCTMNGTAALYCAYFGIGVGPGDEVICPSYTWINTVGPAVMLGARPVFCESDPESMLIDPEDVRRRITARTRAIVAVHLWGNVCDMDALAALSRETGIPLVEDCSHAPGASFNGVPVGRFGRAACWSLQGTKPVSAGEGGVLATDDAEVFSRACLVSQCSSYAPSAHEAPVQPWGLGMKLRPHPVGIAIARIQLDRLPELNRSRGACIEMVEAAAATLPGLRPVRVYPGAQRGGYYGFPLLHEPRHHGEMPTNQFIAMLNEAGVAALPADGYPLLHTLPLFAKGYDLFTRNRGPLGGDYTGYRAGDLPRTEEMHTRLVFLPVVSEPADADELIRSLARVAGEAAR